MMIIRVSQSLLLASLLMGCSASLQEQQSGHDIVDILSLDSTIVLDIRYATENNFTKKVLYPVAKAKLRRVAAESLVSVHRELMRTGLRLKIYDAYRPLAIQWKLWEVVSDPRYVADPRKGSKHNRGAAVDITIIDSLGTELEMPTPYDDFSEKAWHSSEDVPEITKKNRLFLKEIMTRHGFRAINSEWWHYDFQGWEKFEIIDEPLQ